MAISNNFTLPPELLNALEDISSGSQDHAQRFLEEAICSYKPIKAVMNGNAKSDAEKRTGEVYESLFAEFWLSGMRKANKPGAKKAYMRLIKLQNDPFDFNDMLIRDIQNRLSTNQFGFSSTHPSSYLNGERWLDDLPVADQVAQVSAMDNLLDTNWASGLVPDSKLITNQ